jgi:hypothetical protein
MDLILIYLTLKSYFDQFLKQDSNVEKVIIIYSLLHTSLMCMLRLLLHPFLNGDV